MKLSNVNKDFSFSVPIKPKLQDKIISQISEALTLKFWTKKKETILIVE